MKKKNKTNLKKKSRGEITENETEASKLDNVNKTDEYEQDSSDEEVCDFQFKLKAHLHEPPTSLFL